jgi:hypothetical protein
MSLLGIGPAYLQPVRTDGTDPDSAQTGAVQRSRPVTSGASQQLATQGQDNGNQTYRSDGSANTTRFGAQPLNSSGRGQLVNIIA